MDTLQAILLGIVQGITLAPILVIGGFVIEIYAILKRYK